MTNNYISLKALLMLALVTILAIPHVAAQGIQPYSKNKMYWQYKGQPVLLLGGSSNDNLFQQSFNGLDEELELLVANGGNYLRNCMSSRDKGDTYSFYFDNQTGKYDLNKWNDYYWEKYEYFLKETHKKNIIVQIEIWETYDFYTRPWHVVDGKTPWELNPFNPANNINYDESNSGLSSVFQSNGQSLINSFFNTVMPIPEPFDFILRPVVLEFQHKFVDKLMSISLKYDHVLYCIDNETQAEPKWSIYWAQYIRKMAKEQNKTIETSEMFDPFDPSGGVVKGATMQSPATHFFTLRSNINVTLNNPSDFSFIDISNHNQQVGQVHYETAMFIWNKIQDSKILRPINNVKIYGGGGEEWSGKAKDGIERFWRNIFAGAASVRFHRPHWGLGNNPLALSQIKAMREFSNAMNIFNHKPANHLLSDREDNEAYCLANKGKEYAVYFPAKGDVKLNAPKGKYEARWFNVKSSKWEQSVAVNLPGHLKTPTDESWVILLRKFPGVIF